MMDLIRNGIPVWKGRDHAPGKPISGYLQLPVITTKQLFVLRKAAFTLFIISIFIIGTGAAAPVPYRMNISSQPPSVEPGGACIITVFAMGEYMVPLEGVDITLVSRIKGVTLSPDSGKTDPAGRFESIMFANTVENPLITIAGAATTSRDISNIEGVVVDIPLQIPAWENQKPVAVLSAAPVRGGNAPLQVAFSAEQSYDPDGMIITYDWDFGDGERGSGKRNVHTYSHPGSYTATLMVMDHRGGHSDPAFLRVEVQERTVLQSLSGNPVLLSALLAGIVLVLLGIVILVTKRE